MSDLTLTCADCSQEFVFTEGEQDFYKEKNLPQPIYCLICRYKHKAELEDKAQYQHHPVTKKSP